MASELVAHLCKANENFSKDFYQTLPKNDGNILCASFNTHAILSLLLQGASGETAAQLKKALHLFDVEISARSYQHVMYALNLEENVKLYIANKILVHENYVLREEFSSIAEKCFWSEIENISFFPETTETAKKINDWVRNKTNNQIDAVIDRNILKIDTRLALVNAIYFNGQWKYPFCKKSTQKEKFYVSETETIECDMMNTKRMYQYTLDLSLDAQMLLLPYKNNNLKLIIIVPRTITGMTTLEEKLQSMNLRDLNILSSLRREVTLYLPKLKLECTLNMKQMLRQMGLDILFSEYCELNNISTSSEALNVSNVLQKCCIEISEEERDATSVTTGRYQTHGRLRRRRRRKPTPVIVNADHPFYFCIYYTYNEQFLPIFSGKVEHP